MKRKHLVCIVSLLSAITMAFGLLFVTSCKKNDGNQSESVQSVELNSKQKGTYYVDADGQEYTITLRESTFDMSLAGDNVNGSFTYDGATLSLTNPEDKSSFTATFEGDNLAVSYKGKSYTLLKKVSYSVSFETNGGNALDPVEVVNGRKLSVANPEKTGYDFDGWYKDAELKNAYDMMSGVTSNLTLYAGYTAHKYTITFDLCNGGTLETDTTNVAYESDYTLPIPMSTDTYKGFEGWYSQPNGKGEHYTDSNGMGLVKWTTAKDTVLYANWSDGLSYMPVNNGESYSVTMGSGIKNIIDLRIPATYNGKPVTIVEGEAFKNCSNLKRIEIPNTIEVVSLGISGGYYAGSAFYGCSGLLNVDVYEVENAIVPDNYYESIDGVLIYHNKYNGVELKYYPRGRVDEIYTIPSIVETLPINVFASCKFKQVNIPANVIKIDDKAFYSCSLLETVNFLPANEGETEKPLEIGVDVFSYNYALTTVTLPGRLGVFKPTIFNNCDNLAYIHIGGTDNVGTNYASVDGVVTDKTKSTILYCPIGRSGKYEITLATIHAIESEAFRSCTKITEVVIPAYITSIGSGAFMYCSGISTLTFNGEEDSDPLTIATKAFYGCGELESVTLPANLKVLEAQAFGNTAALTSVTVNCSISNASYATGAFAADAGMGKLGMSFVCEITLGDNVPVLAIEGVFGSGAGYKSSIIRVNVSANNNNYSCDADGVLYNKAQTSIIYYPSAKVGNYDIPSTVTTISNNVFKAKAISAITIPASVTSIGATAFADCVNLETVNFATRTAENTLTIGTQAFSGCIKLRSIALPEGTTTIGKSAFEKCSDLTSVSMPSTLTTMTIGTVSIPQLVASALSTALPTTAAYSIFNGCDMLETITIAEGNTKFTVYNGAVCSLNASGDIAEVLYIANRASFENGTFVVPATVTKIHNAAFFGNQTLEAIEFDEGFNGASATIGDYAFYLCSSLNSVVIPSGIKALGTAVFAGTNITSITIPNTVATIGNQTFQACYNLEEVNFEDGNDSLALKFTSTTIANSPFRYDDKIEEMIFPDRTTNIGGYVCSALLGLKRVYVPKGVTAIGTYAFANNTALVSIEFEGGRTASIDFGGNGSALRGNTALTDVILPDNLTLLPSYSFYGCTSLTSIVFPSTLNQTDKALNVFYGCTSLESVTWGKNGEGCPNMTVIGNNFFQSCTSLVDCDLTKLPNLVTIGSYAFNTTGLTSVVIPAKVKVIGASATTGRTFYGCEDLQSVTFATDPETGKSSLTSIAAYTFGCTALTSIVFPDSATSYTLNSSIFEGCKNLESVTISASATTILDIFTGCTAVKTVSIASGSTTYKADGLSPIITTYDGTKIVSVYGGLPLDDAGENAGVYTIPSGVTTIGKYAFAGQNAIRKIVVPASVKTIEERAFQGCIGLEEVVFEEGCAPTSMGTYMFAFCGSLKTVTMPTSMTLLGTYAFDYCTSLEEIDISNIKSSAVGTITGLFFGCYSLKTVTIGNDFKAIPNSCFKSCTSLTTVKYLDSETTDGTVDIHGVTALGSNCFDSCEKITNVILNSTPGSVSFAANAFLSCTGLTSIDLTCATSLGSSVFSGCSNLSSVTFGANSTISTLNGATYVFRYCYKLKEIALPNSVNVIGQFTFRESGISKFSSDKLTDLPQYSFFGCPNLTEVSVPNVLTINPYVFQDCTSLEFVSADKATSIGNFAFANCSSLKTASFPNVSKLGNNIFENCVSLESVYLPSITNLLYFLNGSTVSYTNYIFSGCKNLSLAEFSRNLSYVGNYTFNGCESLQDVSFLSSVINVGNYAFKGCKSIETADISSAYSIGTNAFEYCSSLETVIFSNNLQTISDYAFNGCSSLASATLPNDLVTIGDYAFYGCGLTGNITLTETTYSIGQSAFAGCDGLVGITIPQANTAYHNTVDGMIVDNDNRIVYVPTCYEGTFTLDNNTKLGSYVFAGEFDGVTFAIADGTTEIPAYAFAGLKGVSSITLADSVTKIGEGAFENSDIANVSYANGTLEGLVEIGESAFRYCSNVSSVTFPSTLTSIGDYAYEKSGLTSVTIPANVEYVGVMAFFNCQSLAKVVINEGSEPIVFGTLDTGTLTSAYTDTSYAFAGCPKLTSVTLSSRLTEIYAFMFAYSGLTSINIPSSVKYIRSGAFLDDEYLKTVTFEDRGENNPLYTGNGLDSATSSATGKLGQDGIIDVVDVKSSRGAFAYCYSLNNIDLPEGLINIQEYCFEKTGVVNVVIPSSIVLVSTYVYLDCTSLKTVVFEENESAVTLGRCIFMNCTELTTVVLPDIIDEYGGISKGLVVAKNELPVSMFEGCSKLTSVTIPDEIVDISERAFYGCSSLTSVNIPSAVKVIGVEAFSGCTSLASIIIPETVTNLGSRCFADWTEEQTVTVRVCRFLALTWTAVKVDCNANFSYVFVD